ncbi:RNase adapter RapZ [Cognatilysobacter tabacisoli]|uniref:RNase adapter RapZ n=1 Tax=Cognatilysobacter tabacisoli TaxID=2315424 RepID=UPI000E6B4711|nr:RNase adapter RapZ [Lysobacter tabacisoli]
MSAVPPPPPQATPHGHTLVIVSGMSGSGKSVALKTLEDLGFYCVDNLPAELLSQFAQSVSADETGTPAKLAVGIDVRNRRDLANIPDWLAAVGALGFDPKLVFFDTRDEVLLKRYAETRRRHPLSQLGLPLFDAIALERQVLKPLRQLADAVVDTSDLNVHQLRRLVTTDFAAGHDNTILLMFESFAYRRGIPADADYVFDARILPNPHWDPSLRPLSGRDAGVREYLEKEPDVQLFVQQVSAFLDTWLPRIRQADTTRSYVTVAFGCTGGRHRSVYLAEQMARHARDQGWPDVAVHHRELD